MRGIGVMIRAVAAGLVVGLGGCQLIAGVKDAVPYPADGGAGGGATMCAAGTTKSCYSGPKGTEGVGICKAGEQVCRGDGAGYEECSGEVTPKVESCAGAEDEDCDGHDCVQWAELFGDGAYQFVTDVAIDSNGNIYVTGVFSGSITFGDQTLISAGAVDIFLLKLDPTGKPLWGKQFGDGDYQEGPKIAVDSLGNAYLAGRSATPIDLGGTLASAGLFVAKLSSDGKHLWSKGLTTKAGCSGSDSNVLDLATTYQNDVVVGGYYCGTIDFGEGVIASNGGSRDGFIAKLKGEDGSVKSADQTWGKVFGNAESQELNGLAVDGVGNILVAGTFNGSISFAPGDSFSASGGSDAFVAKFTAAGLPSWRALLGDGADQSMRAIAVDSMGGPVVMGSFEGTVDFGGVKTTTGTSFIAKYDSDGGYKWSKIITTMAAPASVMMDSAGNAILAGVFVGSIDLGQPPLNATGNGIETFAAKLTATGALSWNKRFGDDMSGLGAGASVAITMAGEPILAGSVAGTIDFGAGILTPAGGVDVFIAKLSP